MVQPFASLAPIPLSSPSRISGKYHNQEFWKLLCRDSPKSTSSQDLTPGFQMLRNPLPPGASWGLKHGLYCGVTLPRQARGNPGVPGSPAAFFQSQLSQGRGQSSEGDWGSAPSALHPGRCQPGDGKPLTVPLSTESLGATEAGPPRLPPASCSWLLSLGIPCRSPPVRRGKSPPLNSGAAVGLPGGPRTEATPPPPDSFLPGLRGCRRGLLVPGHLGVQLHPGEG